MMRPKQGKVMQDADQGLMMCPHCTDDYGGLPPAGLADLDPCIWRHVKGYVKSYKRSSVQHDYPACIRSNVINSCIRGILLSEDITSLKWTLNILDAYLCYNNTEYSQERWFLITRTEEPYYKRMFCFLLKMKIVNLAWWAVQMWI